MAGATTKRKTGTKQLKRISLLVPNATIWRKVIYPMNRDCCRKLWRGKYAASVAFAFDYRWISM